MAILAMRADFYGEAARYPGLAEALEVSHALLGPMTEDDLRLVIERPAAATGLRVEPGLTDRILRDVGDEPGGLPLLSHALLETWKRRDGRTLTAAGYAAAGGVRGAIAQTAETVYGGLAAGDQAIARNLFVRLTELGEGTEDTRRRVAFTEVVPAGATGEAVRGVITRLADARLLTTGADSVEVAHEALIREWPRLREWLDDDREGLRLMRHLTESAHSWERLGRDEGELYRGARLTAALEWVERAHPDLNPLEREFLDASRELHQREEREAHARARRLRLLATVASALFVVAAVVGGLAAVQWRSADQARQRSDEAVVEATLSRLETEIPIAPEVGPQPRLRPRRPGAQAPAGAADGFIAQSRARRRPTLPRPHFSERTEPRRLRRKPRRQVHRLAEHQWPARTLRRHDPGPGTRALRGILPRWVHPRPSFRMESPS